MRPIIFFLLIGGLLAGTASALFSPTPVRWALPTLALLLGGAGLVLLHRAVFAPLDLLQKRLHGQELPLPEDTSCGVLRPVAETTNDLLGKLKRDLEQAQRDLEEEALTLEEWREKYRILQAGQQMIRANLATSSMRIHALSAGLPEARSAQATESNGRAGGADTPARHTTSISVAHFLKEFDSDLKFLDACLSQVEKFTDTQHVDRRSQSAPVGDAMVAWSDSLSTGVPAIDGQHKLLLSYINKLHRAIRDGRSENALLEVLDSLAGYAFTHFNTEEIFFSHSDYPDTEAHIRVHEQFKAKVIEFREAVSAKKSDVNMEVLNFLKDWLVQHIQGMDLAFAPYLEKMPEADPRAESTPRCGAPHRVRHQAFQHFES